MSSDNPQPPIDPVGPPMVVGPPITVVNWLYRDLQILIEGQQRLARRVAAMENNVAVSTAVLADVRTALQTLAQEDETDFSAIREGIAKILTFLTPPPPPGPVAAFKVNVTSEEGEIMAKVAKFGKFKIDLKPDGSAVATLSGVVDAFGNPTTFQAPPTYVCETTPGAGQDPNVLLTPAADGLTCGIAANKVLVSGDTLTVTGDGVSESYSPVNVVPGPANSFVISVT